VTENGNLVIAPAANATLPAELAVLACGSGGISWINKPQNPMILYAGDLTQQ